MNIVNPLLVSGNKEPIQEVLRHLAAGENCDGYPYDQMMQAADYIDHLEAEIKKLEALTDRVFHSGNYGGK